MEAGKGLDGSKSGQIQTPMNKTNIGKKGDPGTHSFDKAVGNLDKSAKANTIKGPGANGKWDACEDISGSNLPNKY